METSATLGSMSYNGKKPATYQDLVDLPDNVVGELIDGELFVCPRPAIPHAIAGTRLSGLLSGAFDLGRDGPGGWWILAEPECHFGRNVLVPDLAGWRRERLPTLPTTAAISLVPDWICEVLSPNTGRLDRVKKLPVYASECVGHAWLVDPIARTLEILRLENSRWSILATHEGDEIVRAEPFDAIGIDLGILWGETRAVQNTQANSSP